MTRCACSDPSDWCSSTGQAAAIRRPPTWRSTDGARQLIDIRVRRVQTSCGYGVPLFDYEGPRDTLQRYYDKRHDEVDWDAYLAERSRPQAPIAR